MVTISFQNVSYAVTEASEVIQVCVEIESGSLLRDVAFDLSTVQVTAMANQDFSPIDTTLSFTPNISERCVGISVENDGVVEENMEVFMVRLQSGDPAVNVMMEAVNVAIEDSSFVFLTFLRDGQIISEGGAATVCVILDGDIDRNIDYSLVASREGKRFSASNLSNYVVIILSFVMQVLFKHLQVIVLSSRYKPCHNALKSSPFRMISWRQQRVLHCSYSPVTEQWSYRLQMLQ